MSFEYFNEKEAKTKIMNLLSSKSARKPRFWLLDDCLGRLRWADWGILVAWNRSHDKKKTVLSLVPLTSGLDLDSPFGIFVRCSECVEDKRLIRMGVGIMVQPGEVGNSTSDCGCGRKAGYVDTISAVLSIDWLTASSSVLGAGSSQPRSGGVVQITGEMDGQFILKWNGYFSASRPLALLRIGKKRCGTERQLHVITRALPPRYCAATRGAGMAVQRKDVD